MRKGAVVAIVLGSVLLVAGSIIFGLALANNKDNKPVEKEFTLNDQEFAKFDFSLATTDLKFEPSTDGNKKVVVKEFEKQPHEVTVADGVLTIKQTDTRKWYEHMFVFQTESPSATVYLPAQEYSDITIKASTGAVTIPGDFSFANMNIKVSTGSVNIKSNVLGSTYLEASTGSVRVGDMNSNIMTLKASTGSVVLDKVNVTETIDIKVSTGGVSIKDTTSQNMTINASTGDVKLSNTIIANNLTIKTSTGDVKFDDSDAKTIKVKTDTGNVTGTLLTPKVIYAKTDTGRVDVPHVAAEDVCEIETDTGNIVIKFKN